MSEENTQVPSLRLKPRIRVEAVQTPPPPGAPLPPPTPVDAALPPLPEPSADLGAPAPPPRLRPRILTAENPPEGGAFAPALPPTIPTPAAARPPLPAPSLPPPSLPPPSLPPPTAILPEPTLPPTSNAAPAPDTLEVGRFKLKPRLSGVESPSLPIASLPAAAISGAPQGIKVVATAPAAIAAPPKPTPFIRSATPAPPAVNATPANKNSLGRSFKRNLILLGALAGLVVAVGGFLGLRLMTQMEKKNAEPLVAPKPIAIHPNASAEPKTAKAPAPGAVVANPQSTPGKLVAKARDTIAAREAGDQVDGVNKVLDGDTPAIQSATSTTKANTPAGSADTAPDANAEPPKPAVVIPPKPAGPPPPSADFRMFIVNLHISGVFQGEPARALINSRMIHAGEILDTNLGIKFVGLDPTKKQLVFQDSTGATVMRRF